MNFRQKLILSITIPLVLVVASAVIVQQYAMKKLTEALAGSGANVQAALASHQQVLWMSIGIMILTALTSGGVAYWLIRSALDPVITVTNVARVISEGRLKEAEKMIERIRYRERDEIGQLIEAFRIISTNVLETLDVIVERMQKMAEGDISEELTTHAKGDFEEILNSMRSAISNLKNLMLTVKDLALTLEKRADELTTITSEITEAVNQVAEAISQVSSEAQRQQVNITEVMESMNLTAELTQKPWMPLKSSVKLSTKFWKYQKKEKKKGGKLQ